MAMATNAAPNPADSSTHLDGAPAPPGKKRRIAGGGGCDFDPPEKRSPQPLSSGLFDLLHLGNWEGALCRCASHPFDAAYRVRSAFKVPYGRAEVIRSTSMRDFRFNRRKYLSKYWQCEVGYTPLHMAVLKGAPPELVRNIMKAYPPAVTEIPLDDLTTPLHLLTEVGPMADNAEVLDLFVERYPPHLSVLTEALNVNALKLPSDMVKEILEYVPHPALLGDIQGQTPLHWLCHRKKIRASPSTTRLATSAPSALSMLNENGWTPLHYYLHGEQIGGSDYIRIFDDLAHLAPPSALTIASKKEGLTPVHIACFKIRVGSDIVCALLRHAGPSSGSAKTANGSLPLQMYIYNAEKNGVDVGVKEKFLASVRDLARAEPGALTVLLPGRQYSLLDVMTVGGGTPTYKGPWRKEVEQIFWETMEEGQERAFRLRGVMQSDEGVNGGGREE